MDLAQLVVPIRPGATKLFFLPICSPDPIPIEEYFAKLKHSRETAARKSSGAVYSAISKILPKTMSRERSNFYAQAGCG